MSTPNLPATHVARPLAPATGPLASTPGPRRPSHWRRPALEPVTCLSYGGDRLAAGGGRVCCVWDTTTRLPVRSIVTGARIDAVWMAQDGARVALAAGNDVLVHDVATGARRFAYAHEHAVTSVHIDPGGELMASADASGRIDVRAMATGRLMLRTASEPGRPIVFLHHRRYLLIGATTHSAILDATLGTPLRRFAYDPAEKPVPSALHLPSTLVAYSGSVVRWFDCEDDQGPHCVRDLGSTIQSIDIVEPEGLALVATQDGLLHLFTLSGGTEHARYESYTKPLRFARFGPHASLFVAGGEALVMQLEDGRHVRSYYDDTPPLVAMTAAAGSVLLLSNRDGGVTQVSLRDGTRPAASSDPVGSVSCVAWSADVIACGAYDGTLRLFDARLRPAATFDFAQGPVQAVALDVPSQRAWAGTWDGTVNAIDLRTRQSTRSVAALDRSVRTLALNATGDQLCAGGEGEFCVLDLACDMKTLLRTGQPGVVYRAVFDRAGDLWTTADDGVRRYGLGTGRAHVTFCGEGIRWFDLHGDQLIALSLSGVLAVFDLASGEQRRRTQIAAPVNHRSVLALSPDRIVTASADGLVRVFDAQLREVATLEVLREGYLWMTTPADAHPGWLHTDRPDLVEVGESGSPLHHADPARARHFAVYCSATHVMQVVWGQAAGSPLSASLLPGIAGTSRLLPR